MSTYLDNPSNKNEQPEGKAVPAVKARQGLLGLPVLLVLVGGLVLAVIAWGIAGFYGESLDDDARTTPAQVSEEKPIVVPDNQGVVDNPPSESGKVQMAPIDRDPTVESGTGGPSQVKTPTGTEKTN